MTPTIEAVADELLQRLGSRDSFDAAAEFSGRTLKPGQQVFCMLGSANHDPDVFPDPERFDIRRSNAGDHVAFGAGLHFCLGHVLAHAEGRVALQCLFHTFPQLRPDPNRKAEVLGVARLLGFTHLTVVT